MEKYNIISLLNPIHTTIEKIKGRLSGFYDENIAYVFHKECRITSEDIIFGSFDKSGRTWVRFFIANYISYYYKLGIKVDWNNFVQLTPGTLCKKEGLSLFPNKNISRPIFSHRRSIGRYFPGRKVVYITRNFLDILISYYFFHKHRYKKYYGDLDINGFVRKEFDFEEATNRINYFSGQLVKARNLLILPYESMRKDPEQNFKKLIMFTNYGYDDEVLYRALEHSSFDSMQRMELEQKNYDSKEELHTRKGATKNYADYLDEEVINFVQNLLDQRLKGILKEYYLLRE